MHLSPQANRDEFLIPHGRLGDLVCRFELSWATCAIDDHTQPIIIHPGLHYPLFTPATNAEIEAYDPHFFTNRQKGHLPSDD